MDSFEWNKVMGAVISFALLIMVIRTISDSTFHVEETKPAFTIEVASAGGAAEAAEEDKPSLAVLLASADAAKGARQFAKCKACHTVEKGGRNGTGPNLYGIIGRSVAADDTFKYSSVLGGANQIWTWELMDQWLTSPKNTFKGTSMGFAGIKKEQQRADLMAYLRTFADVEEALPVEESAEKAEEAAEVSR
ncbi:cytochrome c family protein [Kordiimonas sp. SCSIO 12603]|uniref:c-type cytochrome n=1 Tax=Kordiimonas sp. SCSIO 12603 TaxID=2829596 RepID=UPI002102486D|nr:cytochrome c family protein [Kordiimonas sp. SCSIO 12603]UTW58710.1 cytochrome c family protein [Kordiimonas sp. SCSIO 12603]